MTQRITDLNSLTQISTLITDLHSRSISDAVLENLTAKAVKDLLLPLIGDMDQEGRVSWKAEQIFKTGIINGLIQAGVPVLVEVMRGTDDVLYLPDQDDMICPSCGNLIMHGRWNREQAPATAGLYSCSNAAENWSVECENCDSRNRPMHRGSVPTVEECRKILSAYKVFKIFGKTKDEECFHRYASTVEEAVRRFNDEGVIEGKVTTWNNLGQVVVVLQRGK